jgi:acylglycerol lipase
MKHRPTAGRLAGVSGPAVTAGVLHEEGVFEGRDGTKLFEQSWQPAATPGVASIRPDGGPSVKAVVIVVHGLKDHGDHYAALAGELVTHGYAVYSFDLRGHGNSSGDRVYVHRFDDYLDDLGVFLARVKAKQPGRPVFLFGHSMGGAIVTLFSMTRSPDVRGIALSGPALKVGSDLPKAKIGATKFLGAVLPRLAVLSLPNKSFSRDPAVVASMDHDPLIFQTGGPAHTAAELLRAIDRIQAHMEDLKTPFLVMHGTADTLTNPEGSAELLKRSGATDKKMKTYDGWYHDLMHEPENATVKADLIEWLDERSH